LKFKTVENGAQAEGNFKHVTKMFYLAHYLAPNIRIVSLAAVFGNAIWLIITQTPSFHFGPLDGALDLLPGHRKSEIQNPRWRSGVRSEPDLNPIFRWGVSATSLLDRGMCAVP
jgi:hypothetical protein